MYTTDDMMFSIEDMNRQHQAEDAVYAIEQFLRAVAGPGAEARLWKERYKQLCRDTSGRNI